MTSLWAEYIKEREGCETLENESGFITYKFVRPGPNQPGFCFIRDMFVRGIQRNNGEGQKLFEQLSDIAIKAGIPSFVAQVDVRSTNPTHSMGVILSRGFQVTDAQHSMITLSREVGNGRCN